MLLTYLKLFNDDLSFFYSICDCLLQLNSLLVKIVPYFIFAIFSRCYAVYLTLPSTLVLSLLAVKPYLLVDVLAEPSN